MKKLILVDGNSLLFRAYYATAYPGATLMQTQSGIYTNALFAFVNMFEKIIENDENDYLVAFDTKEPTFRHLAYDDYKGNRSAAPEELLIQIPLIHKYLDLLGIKTYFKAGYEADDIIGTLAVNSKIPVDIYSSDRDLLQLVNENITVNLLKKGMKEVVSYNPKTLEEEFNLNHHQMIDLKALTGDPSDNIKGIPGVGEKTAIKLLNEYKTLENILENKDKIKGKLGENIRDNIDVAKLSKMLVTIKTDSNLDITNNDLEKLKTNNEELKSFFQNYELHSLAKKIDFKVEDKNFSYQVISNDQLLKSILKSKMAIYFEFDSENYHRANLWGISLSDGENSYFLNPNYALKSEVFTNYLSDKDYIKYTFNYKAIYVYLKWLNINLANVSFDLLIASYLINNYLGKEEFNYIVQKFDYNGLEYDENIYGRGAKKGLPEDVILYETHISKKALAIFELKDKLTKQLQDEDMYQLFTDVEMPLSKVLGKMEYEGIFVSVDELNFQKEYLKNEIKKLTLNIYKLTEEEFNISSPKQLGEILFDKLKLPFAKKTKTGYSTNQEILDKLKNYHPVINEIMSYRQLTKLYNTYIEGLENQLFEDGKIHTIYMQALTATGRLSSIEPNLQNIPVRSELGKKIRKIFIPSEKSIFMSADYSQIELRVLADIANVSSLKNSFLNEKDIHTETAKKVFLKDEVTSNERRQAKAVNFGIIYGMQAFSLAEDLSISVQEANKFIDNYLNAYPEIKKYMDDIVKVAVDNGYVKTILNRRRYIPELNSKVFFQREFGKRTALNAPIQGSAADIIKLSMVNLDNYIENNNLKSKILLQVHDELILEVIEDEVELIEKQVKKIMTESIKLSVPLVVNIEKGTSWYNLE